MSICALIYYIIGIVLTAYWFAKKYRHEMERNDNPILSFLLLWCIIFWPIKIIWDLLKKFKNISKF
jgi:hypothetical protein